nr:hypothetical protein [Oxalobacteraceae bacterium]
MAHNFRGHLIQETLVFAVLVIELIPFAPGQIIRIDFAMMISPTFSCNPIYNVFIHLPSWQQIKWNSPFIFGNIFTFDSTPLLVFVKLGKFVIASITHYFHMSSTSFLGHIFLPRCFGFFGVSRALSNLFNTSHLLAVETDIICLTSAQKTSIIRCNGS